MLNINAKRELITGVFAREIRERMSFGVRIKKRKENE